MRLIDADELMKKVKKWLPPYPCGVDEKEYPFETDICVSMLMEIEDAPTIEQEQPEIIRCKDCKYRMPYDWMFSEIWQSQNMDFYPEDEIGCAYCDMSMTANDFCSRGERKQDGPIC